MLEQQRRLEKITDFVIPFDTCWHPLGVDGKRLSVYALLCVSHTQPLCMYMCALSCVCMRFVNGCGCMYTHMQLHVHMPCMPARAWHFRCGPEMSACMRVCTLGECKCICICV